jgi:nucleoside-diphosphate-sugar epimerase
MTRLVLDCQVVCYNQVVLDYYRHKTVLLTGVAGFVGSHLADRLLELGATVIGVDNFITGRSENIAHLLDGSNPNFAFIEADATQSPATYLSEDVELDVVFHFASPASPPRYQEHPVETYLINALGTHHLLDYLQNNNPQGRFVFASTSEIYGDPQVHPQPESYWGNVNPNGPRSCYDESKRFGETVCGVFHRNFEMDVRIVRIFNTYGPRINPDDGRIIPNFIKQALAGEDMTVYGDGQQTRSYCYVSDLIEGVLRLGAADNLSGETVNIGNPEEYTVKETAEIISEAVGVQLHMVNSELPQDDPTQRCPDITKAEKLLQWQPTVSFAEGLQKTIAYFREG